MSLCIMIIIIINRNDYALKERGFIMHWTIIGGGIQELQSHKNYYQAD